MVRCGCTPHDDVMSAPAWWGACLDSKPPRHWPTVADNLAFPGPQAPFARPLGGSAPSCAAEHSKRHALHSSPLSQACLQHLGGASAAAVASQASDRETQPAPRQKLRRSSPNTLPPPAPNPSLPVSLDPGQLTPALQAQLTV